MPLVGFKPAIPAHEWLQTQALVCAAAEIGLTLYKYRSWNCC